MQQLKQDNNMGWDGGSSYKSNFYTLRPNGKPLASKDSFHELKHIYYGPFGSLDSKPVNGNEISIQICI